MQNSLPFLNQIVRNLVSFSSSKYLFGVGFQKHTFFVILFEFRIEMEFAIAKLNE